MAKSRQPAEDVYALKLTARERAFLLAQSDELEASVVACLQEMAPKAPLQLNFDQLEELAFHVTALVGEAPVEKIDPIFRKISDGMRALAALEQEAGGDELRQVISIQKEREARRSQRRSR
jgi:hypothetical protein